MTTDFRLTSTKEGYLPALATMNNDPNEIPIVSMYPKRLFFGIVSCGFFYRLRFNVQNNSLAPIRIKIHCFPNEGELNSMRVVNLPDKIAPGMTTEIMLELTAEFSSNSIFTLQIRQSADERVYSRLVEAQVVSQETFKYVKKGLQLSKRPIYRHNVSSVGQITGMEMQSIHTPATSFSETLIMDDEDIEDLLEMPMAPNIYWDPFETKLRIDPILGKVVINKDLSLEEAIQQTMLSRQHRLQELDEQGFLTIQSLDRLKESQFIHAMESPTRSVLEGEEDGDGLNIINRDGEIPLLDDYVEDSLISSRASSQSKLASVSSLMALKRDRIEKLRRATVNAADEFSKTSRSDSMVNSMRTLKIIQTKHMGK